MVDHTQPNPAPARRFLTSDPGMIERFGDPFRPLEPNCRVVQFGHPLTPRQLELAGGLVADRPDVELYVYGTGSRDLDFLQYFPNLRRLHVALYELRDIAGLTAVPGLEKLTFGQTKKSFSLAFLPRLPRLGDLFLVGHKKDLEAIQTLAEIERLGLSQITLDDLSVLRPLRGLRRFALFLGGTRDLSMLPFLPALQELWLMRITKLADLQVLSGLKTLKSLRLDWLRNVTMLPSLDGLTELEQVELDTMKGLKDLSPIAAAPGLRRLTVTNMPQLSPEDFRCFVGHPALEELWVGTGRARVNEAVRQMLPSVVR